jgi:hypothetical protein
MATTVLRAVSNSVLALVNSVLQHLTVYRRMPESSRKVLVYLQKVLAERYSC